LLNSELYKQLRHLSSPGLYLRSLLLSRPLHSEDRGRMDLWNFGNLPQHYTVSQTRRPRLESWPPWNSHIYQTNVKR